MKRPSLLSGYIIFALSGFALVVGCGGGRDGIGQNVPPTSAPPPPGNTSPPPDPPTRWPNQKIGGFWNGVSSDWGGDTPGSSPMKLDIMGIVTEDGRAYFIRDDWTMYWGELFTDGKWVEGEVAGGVVMGVKSFGHAFWDGSTAADGGADNMLMNERESLSGDFVIQSAAGNQWWASLAMLYDDSYNYGSSLDTIAGNYVDPTGLIGGIHGGVLNITATGALFIQSAATGCVANGNVAVIDAAYNAYEINIAYSNCGAADAFLNGATFTGLATYQPMGVRLIAFVHGSVGGTPTPDYFWFERR
jgi:hypothetical protein